MALLALYEGIVFYSFTYLTLPAKWHTGAISMGHTHTMIHLFVRKDEDGYYFELSGGLHCRNVVWGLQWRITILLCF